MGKRAVMGLPVRLAVVFLIISISMPVLMNVMEQNKENASSSALENEFGRFYDTVSKVHYSGIGSTRTLTIEIPERCEMFIGGEGSDAYSMRASYDGNVIITRYMEKPTLILLFEGSLGPGKHTLMITSVLVEGGPAAEVREI